MLFLGDYERARASAARNPASGVGVRLRIEHPSFPSSSWRARPLSKSSLAVPRGCGGPRKAWRKLTAYTSRPLALASTDYEGRLSAARSQLG